MTETPKPKPTRVASDKKPDRPRTYKKANAARDDAIAALARDGVSRVEIAGRYGLSPHRIQGICAERGVYFAQLPTADPAVAASRARANATIGLNRPLKNRVESGTDVYADDEAEFLRAAEAYRVRYQFAFLRATDYLHVAKGLGYRKP